MAKITYHGPEAATELYGLLFPRGQAVDVPDDHPHIKKLLANPVFNAPPPAEDAEAVPHKGKKHK